VIVNEDPIGFPPTAVFYEEFTLPSFVPGISVTVWADDTATVYFNGVLIKAANPNQDGACAADPVGCTADEGLTFTVLAKNLRFNGAHNVLAVNAYQGGGDTFGVMYEGSAIPEPGTYALLGLGLTAIGLTRKFIGSAW
jgi:hypothetical protein